MPLTRIGAQGYYNITMTETDQEKLKLFLEAQKLYDYLSGLRAGLRTNHWRGLSNRDRQRIVRLTRMAFQRMRRRAAASKYHY